jgi:cysteine desulfurase/selenocysteine lyase
LPTDLEQQTTYRFDVDHIREDFPALHQKVFGNPLVYFDNASTTQKPQQIIDRISRYYSKENSNVHRGVHYLSQQATEYFEQAREAVRTHMHAEHTHEIIFTSGTTNSINLVAYSFGDRFVHEGDEILVSGMEHHSNIVPWQLLCERKGAILRVIPVLDDGSLDLEAFSQLLSPKTRLVAVIHMSNTLGTINPVKEMIRKAHEHDIPVLVDGAQAMPHMRVDVQDLDADFYAFSGHKVFGPTGVGVLYGKEKWLNAMPPFMAGGEMIEWVSFEKTTFNHLPHKFEAGTPNIADVIGLHSALEYVSGIGYDAIGKQEEMLLQYGTELLTGIPDVRLIGTAASKGSVLSFLIGDIHPYDGGTILDRLGIAVRTGHHCTMPLMDRYSIPGTMRASLAFYNTKEELDRLADGILQVKKMFGK